MRAWQAEDQQNQLYYLGRQNRLCTKQKNRKDNSCPLRNQARHAPLTHPLLQMHTNEAKEQPSFRLLFF